MYHIYIAHITNISLCCNREKRGETIEKSEMRCAQDTS